MSLSRTAALCLLLLCPLALAEEAAGISWKAPAAWKAAPAKPMRVVTYELPAAKGDSEGGELAVFYFGQGQGGGVQANVDRWVSQFTQPDGSESAKKAKVTTSKRGGHPTTEVDLKGTYASGGMMGPAVKKPGYRLRGAIVEAPEGAVFFKLTGPEKTVAAAEKDFAALLKSIR